jgi:hypothetical protein
MFKGFSTRCCLVGAGWGRLKIKDRNALNGWKTGVFLSAVCRLFRCQVKKHEIFAWLV